MTLLADAPDGLDLPALFGLDPDEQGWQDRAACAEVDPEAFFPEKGGSTREAKSICQGCEVRADCLLYALDRDEHGIWGGLSPKERRRLKSRGWRSGDPTPDVRMPLDPGACPQCGKLTGSVKHHLYQAHGIRSAA